MLYSKVYSFRNKKKVWWKIPRFIKVKNEKEFDKLIDKLLDIDAVSEVSDFTFPCVVEVLDGTFAPELREYKVPKTKEAIKSISKLK